MGFSFIREGDTTSHGGNVLTCTSSNIVHGKPLALLGDMVSCPKCGGVYPIVDVKGLGMTFNGRPVAADGDKTACGATLIASQSVASALPPSGKSAGAAGTNEPQTSPDSFRGRFQVLDDATREPLPNYPYTVKASDGTVIQGTTDADGYTQWHEADQASSLTFSQSGGESAT